MCFLLTFLEDSKEDFLYVILTDSSESGPLLKKDPGSQIARIICAPFYRFLLS